MADVASLLKPIASDIADHYQAWERNGVTEIQFGYIGDAGGGEVEPHDQVFDDLCAFSRAAAEVGLEVEPVCSDHDSFMCRVSLASAPAA